MGAVFALISLTWNKISKIIKNKQLHTMRLIIIVFFLNLVFTNIHAKITSQVSDSNHENMISDSLPAKLNTSQNVIECPDGWIYEGRACFYFNVDDSKVNLTWTSAQGECEKMGGHLAEPITAEEQEFLKSISKIVEASDQRSNWWIGLSDTSHEGRWFWQYNETAVTFSSWVQGRPNSESPNFDDCAMLYSDDHSYDWQDVNCEDPSLSFPISFVCQKANDGITSTTEFSTITSTSRSSTPSTTMQPLGCDEINGWNEFEDHCYKIFNDDSFETGWNEAKDICLSHDANLASIHSQDEDDFITSISVNVKTHSVWFGLYWDNEEFKYEDGSIFDYSNWDSSNSEPDEDGCVLKACGYDYRWWDSDCDAFVGQFVCKKLKH